MSIFQKVCPKCAAVHSTKSSHCSCGYSFDEEELSVSKLSDEMLAEEEALYEEYLAVRAKQAGKEAAAAAKKTASSTDFLDHNHAEVDEKKLSAKIAQAQLKAQTDRATASKKAADAKAKAKADAKTKAKHKQQVLAKTKKKTEETKTRARAKAEAMTATMAAAREKVDAAIKSSAKAKASAKARIDPAHNALKAARRIKDKIHEKASALFHTRQTEKAEQVVQKKRVRKVVLKPIAEKELLPEEVSVTTSQHQTAPEPSAFRATQAARAEKIKNTKECPNCTAQLNKKAKSCKCGYTFESGASLLPSLSLDMNDVHDTKATITDIKITTRRVGD